MANSYIKSIPIKSMRLKDITLDNRPRERLHKYGASALSDAELLALILKTGSREENVIDLSNRLISKYGIDKLSSCSLRELQEIKGIGSAKASQILAIFEITKRRDLSASSGRQIRSAEDVYTCSFPKIGLLNKEHFMALYLDSKNRIIKDEIVSIGILNSSLVHPREVFRSAIKECANSIVLVHNHPSGDPLPSEEDDIISKKLFDVGKLLSIEVLDHVIIGKGSYYSFKDKLVYLDAHLI